MEDSAHIFELLFHDSAETQLENYKADLEDLFKEKRERETHKRDVEIDCFFAEPEVQNDVESVRDSPTSSNSTTVSCDFVEDEQEKEKTVTFSCNGTSDLPRHIQDVRERVKKELGVKTNLNLTDEERRLLKDEGVELPEDLPLTKAETRVLNKVRRKIRNKRSAVESRRRKKEHFDKVEGELGRYQNENDDLKKKVSFLERQNIMLMNQLRKLQESVMMVPQSRSACALCVMIFSLFVFCYPGAVGPLTFDGGEHLYPIIENENFQPVAGFKGRKILSTELVDEIANETDNTPPDPVPEIQEALTAASHRSVMPQSPEDYIISQAQATFQGEM